jgi:hypothetical protein
MTLRSLWLSRDVDGMAATVRSREANVSEFES